MPLSTGLGSTALRIIHTCWVRVSARTGEGLLAASSNEEMQPTKPDGRLAGGRGARVHRRGAIVLESGFAADLRCSADLERQQR
jgi:hypothetical protein